MQYDYKLTKLPNGVRIASIEMPHMKSACVGIWAGIGGRHENRKLSGISHFIEHLLFKGTHRRSAKQIIEAVEGVGGYMNAFTTEDHTCYYAKAAAPHLGALCDVLCDMYCHSKFAPEEVERERDVIREEILMYRDQPAQHADELLSETLWPAQPLGRPLTGTVDTISGLQRPRLKQFVRENYTGRTTVVTVAGRVTHDRAVKMLAPRLTGIPSGRKPRMQRARNGGTARISLMTQETEQTHLALGFHGPGRLDERRFALKLLSVILGENMSSRLFQILRERHGFCYSVQSGLVTFEDTGALHICAGIDTAKLERALKMILREVRRICRKAPSKSELRKAQDYTIGQTFMGLESTTNQMIWMGESILSYGHVLDPGDIERRLLAVTPEEIRRVACDCFETDRLAVAIVGPVSDKAGVESWLG